MSFNIFGPATKKDIRVGYIDPDLGYVQNISILEANKYAALNPGTMFILKTRDVTRYLTLNEVNALTPDVLDVDGNVCGGIQGLRPGERAPFSPLSGTGSGGTGSGGTQTGSNVNISYDDGCRGRLFLSGGGGVGAVGSPIFGRDGSLLAIRVVRGGFGYKYPPKAKLVDSCRRGSGAVIRTIIGELPPTTEYFDQEEDFEIYDLTPDGTELSGYGLRYGVAGEILGDWDPNLFATLAADPIQLEIDKYQDFLRQGINPFWHTRKENPISVTFRDKTTRVLHQVSHVAWSNTPPGGDGSPIAREIIAWYGARWGRVASAKEISDWIGTGLTSKQVRAAILTHSAKVAGYIPKATNLGDSFMNRYAVSPVPASSARGSDYAGYIATMEWEENFPYTGEYTFRGMGDNIARCYLDNELVTEARNFRGDPLPQNIIKKTIQEGVHRIKIDLYNIPIREKVKPQKPQDLTITYHGLNRGITNSGERKYPIEFDGLNSANNPIDVSGSGKTIKLKDGDDNDTNASFRIMSDSPGVGARFSSDGRELKVKGSGDVTLRLEWNDNPSTAGVAVKSIKVGDKTWRQSSRKGDQTETIKVGSKETKEVVGRGGYIVSGDKKKVKMKDGHGDDINSTFSIESSTNNARFSDDGKRLITDGPGNVKLRLKWDDNPRTAGVAVDKISVGGIVLDQRGEKGSDTKTLVVKGSPNSSTSSTSSGISGSDQTSVSDTIFNTIDYINKADRKLWRTNVYGRGGFINDFGVCPFNTRKPLDDNPYAGTHTIRWSNIDFPTDGNYNIEVDVDDFAKISIDNGRGDVVNVENGMKKTTHTKFFKKGKYKIKVDLLQVPGGRFSFDGDGKPKSNRVTARFVNRDGKNYLKVDGSGTAEISFKLRVDDNPRTSGVFASKVKIGLPPNDYVLLSRSRSGSGYKERETITGSDVFEAGREYLIDAIGSSRSTGSRIRNNGKEIQYDDNIDNGFDNNGELSITKIKNQQPSSVKGINPMALAINIQLVSAEVKRISPRSWNENPMGAALTIDAPLPPIPESPIPVGEGRCPKNPIWTTRFPGAQKKWWPVNHFAWSKFTNRFALSPLPPLSTLNSDGGGGVTYENTWPLEIPYDGFYGIKGTADNAGRILIDGQEVYKFKGFKNTSPKIEKVKLIEGKHTITVEVENFRQENSTLIKKKIFSTQDWSKPIKEGPPNPAELLVEYRGLNQGITKTVSGNKEYQISYDGLNSANNPIDVSGSGKTIKLKDGDDNDTNASFRIMSDSPGVGARFSSDGRSLNVKKKGNVTLRLEWNDNPSTAGVAVKSISVGGKTWRQSSRKGSQEETINVGANDTQEVIGKGGYIVSGNDVKMKDGHGDDINSTFSIVSSTVDAKFSSDGKKINYKGSGEITLRLKWDDDPKTAGKAVDSIAVGGKVWNQKGEKNSKTQTIKVTAESSATGGIQSGKQIGGVTYDGLDIFKYIDKRWSDFMNKNNVSPFLPPLGSPNPKIIGNKDFTWSNVDFPESGRYEFKFHADNAAILFINGVKSLESKSFRGEPITQFVDLSAGKYQVRVQLLNDSGAGIIFNDNPTGFALRITKDIKKVLSTPAWTRNPLCASAIMIPPPCPKVIQGTGVVTDIIAEEPGNGYPVAPGGGPPVTLVLKEVIPTSPGINYGPDDLVLIDGKPLKPILGPFGTVDGVEPSDRPFYGFTEYPNITMPSDTGVGFRGTPVFDTVIVPELVLPEDQLLQVTDLVGLKQTGYVNGRPYYGSTFSQDGILYAGVYETTGDLVQVYATLQESVDGQVTTRASAILRQGSDVTSNDPRLNIPNTPDNLV